MMQIQRAQIQDSNQIALKSAQQRYAQTANARTTSSVTQEPEVPKAERLQELEVQKLTSATKSAERMADHYEAIPDVT